MAAEGKIYDSGGNGLDVWIANGLNFHMTPKTAKIMYAWASTGHLCEVMKIRLRRN